MLLLLLLVAGRLVRQSLPLLQPCCRSRFAGAAGEERGWRVPWESVSCGDNQSYAAARGGGFGAAGMGRKGHGFMGALGVTVAVAGGRLPSGHIHVYSVGSSTTAAAE